MPQAPPQAMPGGYAGQVPVQAQNRAPEEPSQAAPGAATAPTTAPTTAASNESQLITEALAGLAMRDLSLVDSLLDVVEHLEESTEAPELLEQLFKIDNLATRMRRNGENLLVLADQDAGDPRMEAVSLLDVARGAVSEISDYNRVMVGRLPEKFLVGPVADDASHLLAELLDNATAKSPEHAQVVISAQPMADGNLLIVVEDEGIGIPKDQLADLNERLSGRPVLDNKTMRHMGLYVVSRIAHRHGLQVQLEARAFRGMNAYVVVPTRLLSDSGPPPEAEEAAPKRTMASPAPAAPQLPPPPPTAPTPRAQTMTSAPTENNGPLQDGPPSSGVTSSGLPRRSANRSTMPMQELPDQDSAQARNEDSGDRAARISADIDSFLEGERAATNESNEPE